MGPQRLDRAELRRRLADEVEPWVVDDLADRFETAFLGFRRQADEAERQQRKPKARADKTSDRRTRRGKGQSEGDDA